MEEGGKWVVNSKDFAGDKSRLWLLENKWRSDIVQYGLYMRKTLDHSGLGKVDMERRGGDVLYELYRKVARMELALEKIAKERGISTEILVKRLVDEGDREQEGEFLDRGE